jgi:uncharacterized protein YggE
MGMEDCMEKTNRFELIALMGLVGLVFLAVIYFAPWKNVTWGRFKLTPGDTVTIVGEAKTKQKNQKATFSAGVNVVSDNKDTAIADVNRKVQAIIDGVKAFGVAAEDIKTQNLNVYQGEETYYDGGTQKARPGQWRVSNTVEITLTDVDRAQGLADVLTRSGANNIYGPNFSIDDTADMEGELIDEAMKNAYEKALKVAASSGRKLGKMVSFTEGYQPMPVYRMEGGGGGGGGIEPGTATVSKTVTVTYELAP